MVGADPEQMRALAASFERAAEQLDQISKRVRNGIQLSAWAGPVALRFRATWDTEHSLKLSRAAAALAPQARHLLLETEEQERASAASTIQAPGGSPRVGHRELVEFAWSGYHGNAPVAIDGYTLMSDDELRKLGVDPGSLRDTGTGFDAKVYHDTFGRVIVAFGGTQGTEDWSNNVAGVNPLAETPQAKGSVELALTLKNSVGAENLTFTGHSLGGRNAAIAALATGVTTVTYNSAGVSAADYLYASTAGGTSVDLLQYVAAMHDDSNRLVTETSVRPAHHVTNYSTHNDALSLGQDFSSSLPIRVVPTALGNQQVVWSGNVDPLASHNDLEAFRRGIAAD